MRKKQTLVSDKSGACQIKLFVWLYNLYIYITDSLPLFLALSWVSLQLLATSFTIMISHVTVVTVCSCLKYY